MNSNLTYKLQIIHDGVVLSEESINANDAILDLIREREYNMIHSIENLAIRAIRTAIKEYDFKKANSKN